MGLLRSILKLQLILVVGSSFWILATADKRILLEPEYSLHERPPTQEGEPLLIQVCCLKIQSFYMFNCQASINLRNILEVWEKEQLVSLETEALLEGDITNYQNVNYIVHRRNWNIKLS